MGSFGNWLRRTGQRIKAGFLRFMDGRYGGDKLNITLVWVSLAAYIISLLIPVAGVKLLLLVVYYGILGWAIFRFLSRNIYKRYEENRKFLLFFQKLKDKDHRYYNCPRCRQQVRVPKGKGKISITCPKCREKFIKTT